MDPESCRRDQETGEPTANDTILAGEPAFPNAMETHHGSKTIEDLKKSKLSYPVERTEGDLSTKCQLYFPDEEEAPLRENTDFASLQTWHATLSKTWKASTAYGFCRTLFQDIILKQEGIKITSCMCLSLGSFSGVASFYKASMSQLVVLESWLELLATQHTINHVYFQEPNFNALDRQFLEAKGYSIIDHPEFEDVMTAETFLFMPGGYYKLVPAALQIAFPPLYYGVILTKNGSFMTSEETEQSRLLHGCQTALPRAMVHERNVLRPFLDQRIAAKVPHNEEHFDWLEVAILYYKPDSTAQLKPVVFEYEDHECYNWEQAYAAWYSRGLRERKHYWGGFFEQLVRQLIFRCLLAVGWFRRSSYG